MFWGCTASAASPRPAPCQRGGQRAGLTGGGSLSAAISTRIPRQQEGQRKVGKGRRARWDRVVPLRTPRAGRYVQSARQGNAAPGLAQHQERELPGITHTSLQNGGERREPSCAAWAKQGTAAEEGCSLPEGCWPHSPSQRAAFCGECSFPPKNTLAAGRGLQLPMKERRLPPAVLTAPAMLVLSVLRKDKDEDQGTVTRGERHLPPSLTDTPCPAAHDRS